LNKIKNKIYFIFLQDFAFLQQFVNCSPHFSSRTGTGSQSSLSRPARTPNSQHLQHIFKEKQKEHQYFRKFNWINIKPDKNLLIQILFDYMALIEEQFLNLLHKNNYVNLINNKYVLKNDNLRKDFSNYLLLNIVMSYYMF